MANKYIKHTIGMIACEPESKCLLPKEIVATAHPHNIASRAILQKTLKSAEQELLIKYDGNPRVFFFKPLKPVVISAKPMGSGLEL